MRFDSASISGQSLNNATLTLYLNDLRSAGTISIHAITSSWNESTVNWNNQPPAQTTATVVVNLATSDEGSAISIEVTDVVQRWADGSLADAGFLIVTSDGIKAILDTKEKSGGTPATMEVDTGPPEFSGETIVLDLTNPGNCTIDEPGYYVIDRTWLFAPNGNDWPNANCVRAIIINSGGVMIA